MGIGFSFEDIGRVAVGGSGHKVAVGVIFGLLEDLTPLECYNHINENTDLVLPVSEEDWVEIRRISKDVDLNKITVERIVEELRKHRLELLSLILSTPGGLDWVTTQLDKVKAKLSG